MTKERFKTLFLINLYLNLDFSPTSISDYLLDNSDFYIKKNCMYAIKFLGHGIAEYVFI